MMKIAPTASHPSDKASGSTSAIPDEDEAVATTTEALTNDDNHVMRVIVYDLEGEHDVKSALRPRPDPGRLDRVLVRVHAVGLNPSDQKSVVGDKLPANWSWTRAHAKPLIQNKIVGVDFAGVVVEDHASLYKPGDKVFGCMPPLEGTLAEYISVPLEQLCFMPKNMSFVQGAALPLSGLTAFKTLSPCLLTANHPHHPKSVLIIGASGGTGHFALQVARNLGAQHITAVCSGVNKSFVQSFGATHVIDYTQNDQDPNALYDNLHQAPGCPFDVVLDCVTSNDPRDLAIHYPELIRQNHGTIGKKKEPLVCMPDHHYIRLGTDKAVDWMRAGAEHVCGLAQKLWLDPHEKLVWADVKQCSHELHTLKDWTEQGLLKVCVTRHVAYTAKAIQRAFDALNQRHVRGKLVVEVIPSADDEKDS